MSYLTLPKYILERDDDHPLGGRHYNTEFGWSGSVTNRLSQSKDMRKINEWREWKGEEQAARILKIAGWRGTGMHAWIEDFLLHGQQPAKPCMLRSPYWNSIKTFLPNIVHSALLEGAVWHPEGFAGCIDFLGYHKEDNGDIGLCDWKSADSLADEIKLYDYRLQAAAYTAAAEYVYRDFDLFIPRARIVIALPDAKPQIVLMQRNELEQLFIHFKARTRYANANTTKKKK